MMTKTRKTIMYIVAVVTTISSLVVIAAGLALMSLYDMSWSEQAIFWANTPLLSGVLSTAIIIALSAMSLPVLACVWLINELARGSHTVHAAYIPHSLGTLKPSGNVYWAGSGIADPEGNSVSLE